MPEFSVHANDVGAFIEGFGQPESATPARESVSIYYSEIDTARARKVERKAQRARQRLSNPKEAVLFYHDGIFSYAGGSGGPENLEQYIEDTGHGWYIVSGHNKKVRGKENALKVAEELHG